ncbi:flagellar biosynthesis anti-sigma factor FlgM [Endozoicomonas gorgoniicola]|uniref:Flagellar biosynthesis anti-sigma factor FlgM n=1 Tax=Endozoicomonas gorgoniicola TaxID=1234144 RepID=A0ABT3MW63_9GAMM|nr:flagellar biosynthesis anti-sigma factor FlgM [Endozoicomonas gorgoniicola]MCW7553608.1 flagellar biosynthesis anti-sigma factor FlgM [Endozoicomonas gorgoniicola]
MEDKVQPEYKATQVVEVGSSEERVRALREAYLNGTLVVDSAKLAQKMLSFERELDRLYHNDSK